VIGDVDGGSEEQDPDGALVARTWKIHVEVALRRRRVGADDDEKGAGQGSLHVQ
jgi:hypothetical protein